MSDEDLQEANTEEALVENTSFAHAEDVTDEDVACMLPHPAPDANKYSRGKATLVVGSSRYPGAACLAAVSAQRVGAGYVEVVTDEAAARIVQAARPSVVVTDRAQVDFSRLSRVKAGHPQAVCVGSGFDGAQSSSEKLVFEVLEQAACPVVVDGGGLAALATAGGRALLRRRFIDGRTTVITPHGGEAHRLAAPFGFDEGDPAHLSQLLSLALGAIVVLKGSDTFISDGDCVRAMRLGTAALAKAGTGDVLAGMVTGLIAQGLDSFDACMLATTLHARAGRIAQVTYTDIAVCAEDVIESLPAALRGLDALGNGIEEG